jgi:hypothetical protein
MKIQPLALKKCYYEIFNFQSINITVKMKFNKYLKITKQNLSLWLLIVYQMSTL